MKNKKGLILIYPGFQNEAKKYQYNRLIEEFNKKGISIDKLKVDEQYTSVINGNVNIDVKKYDFCIQLVKDKYINEQLCKNGIRSFNSYNAIENCDDKMMTYVILSNKNINLPRTILGSINFGVENIKEDNKNEEFKKYVETTLNYPFITKKCNSKGGRDIYKINSRNEFDDICNKLSGSQYLFQQFIPENIGKDIRVVVVGKKVVGSFMRINENDYRSNISLGGKAVPYEVSNEYKEIAEKVANELELDYCSVDFFMSNENNPIVCEVNADPAICDIEELSGKNVAGIFVDYVISEIY